MQLVESPHFVLTECCSHKTVDIWFNALSVRLYRLAKFLVARHAINELSETALLHDAYVQMASRTAPPFVNEMHFTRYVSRVMKSLIVDHARNRNALKRGGSFEITHLVDEIAYPPPHTREIITIRHTLIQLAKAQPELAELVDLKFFHGFSFAEIAVMQEVSERTVQRKWEKARMYMRSLIQEDLKI
ncbi:ECF-type sigma factor [Tunturiibacter lichenicola]|uniref:ECF-type sigma factor n=1 Tax=Tunturiibacter lichenicola TaxID=2051959 RepID=UPI003D9B40A8